MSLSAGRTEVNQGTLTIKNLSPADSGLYDCVATNIIGTKKARINVAIQRKPGLPYLFGFGGKHHCQQMVIFVCPNFLVLVTCMRWK